MFCIVRRFSRFSWRGVLALVLIAVAGTAAGGERAPQICAGFACAFFDPNPDKPAWVKAADLDRDGTPELVVSVFAGSSPVGAGYIAVYRRDGDVTSWKKAVLPGSEGTKFANDTTIVDVDGDGDPDIVAPSGFLATTPFSSGALAWFENLGNNAWKKQVITQKQKLFYHFVEYVDIDGDGHRDFVTVAESKGAGVETQYFKGQGQGKFAATPTVIAKNALGSIPRVVDLDRDGDPDIVSAQYFVTDGAAAWLENLGGCAWRKHVIDDRIGPSIQLSLVPDLCGDGRTMAVLANHVNSADTPQGPKEGVFLLPVPETADELIAPWPGKLIATGIKSRPSPAMMPQGAPGVFRWGDIDGDADIDLVVHGDGIEHDNGFRLGRSHGIK